MEVEQVNKPGITSGGNWPDISPCRLESAYRRHACKPLKFMTIYRSLFVPTSLVW